MLSIYIYIISSVLIMTSHINLIEASVQARAQWWGAEDTPCSLEGRHSQFQLGLNSEDGWSKKKHTPFCIRGYVWGNHPRAVLVTHGCYGPHFRKMCRIVNRWWLDGWGIFHQYFPYSFPHIFHISTYFQHISNNPSIIYHPHSPSIFQLILASKKRLVTLW